MFLINNSAQLREEQARALRLASEKAHLEGHARNLESDERKRMRDQALRDIEANRHKKGEKGEKLRTLVLKVNTMTCAAIRDPLVDVIWYVV
jgi:hypothetical protein